jgi:hypothetical protein
VEPRVGAPPVVELRQWRDGGSVAFDANADLGAGVTHGGGGAGGIEKVAM